MVMIANASAREVRIALNLESQLGEGLHWDARTQRLWGVDIHGMQVWRWDLTTEVPDNWKLTQRIGWVLPTTRLDRILLGLQGGIALASANDPTCFEWMHQPFLHNTALRLNDAKTDETGAVWAGSLNNDDESKPEGCLYRLGPDGNFATVDTDYTVANGPAISADGTLMLHTDSGRRTIYAFDLGGPAGKLSNKRIWKVFDQADGYPDGMCFDAEGHVWVAHWGAGCISRFAQDGTLVRRVRLPATNVSNVCFGGHHLDRLFVTSARVGLTEEQLAEEPVAGSLFEVLNPGVNGLPCLPYGLQ